MSSRDPSSPAFPTCPAPSAQPPPGYLLALQGLVDGQTPVVVHGEQDGFACVVEPWGSSHVHPPLPGGHDRCDCVPCHRRKQAGLWPCIPGRTRQGPTNGSAVRRAGGAGSAFRAGWAKVTTQSSHPQACTLPRAGGNKGSQVGPLQGLADLECAHPLPHLKGKGEGQP